MAAGLVTPTEAGQGPSVLNIAMSIGAKIRDAAEDAKEQREKAAEKGETPKKGSLFKSALSNQFNPIKSKKAKSNWAKQFDWNKETNSDQQVKPPSGESGGDSKGRLKEFIAGGFTAILRDTGMMVSKLDGVKAMTGENLSEVTRASSTLTVIKDSIDAQTELRRKALEEAKFARAEKKLEKTSDVAGVSSPKDSDKKDDDGDGGGGLLDNLANALGIADLLDNVMPGRKGKPGRNPLSRLNPFNRSPVTQGRGGKPQGFNPLRKSPSITTSGGVPAPKPPGGFKLPKLPGLPKGIRPGGMGGPLTALFAGFEFAGRKSEGQNNLQAGVGTAGSVAGGLGGAALGAKGGAAAGAAIGALFGGVGALPGAAIGAALGSILGGIGGSMGGGKLADMATGVDKPMSEGGMVPSAVPLARGGIVDNPTKTTLNPGDSVIPLNRNVGKQMLGDANQATPGETAIDTVGAMILGVSSGMLGKTETGTVGDQVKQDIRKASKQFGISNLTFTSSIGRGQFGKVDTKKDSKDFMQSLFENLTVMGGANKKSGGGGGNNKPPNAADVAGQAQSMVGQSAQEAAEFMDKQDEVLTKAGIPDAIYGSDKVKGDVIDAAWCASYVAAILADKGYKPPNSALADAYAPGKWGETIDPKEAKPGDIITFDYSGQKKEGWHVAIVTANDGQTITYVGGNQGSTGSSKTNKVTEGSIKVTDSTLLGITRPKETLSNSGNPRSADAKQTAQATQGMLAPIASSGQASLPSPTVTQVAQSGMVGGIPPEPAWWDIGGRINRWLDEQTYPERYNKKRAIGNNPYFATGDRLRQMKEQGYASGGSKSQAEMRRKMRAGEKSRRATQQRNMLGVVEGGGKSGYTVTREGMRPGETPEQWSERQSQAIRLADKLNKQAKLGKYAPKAPPKPAPKASPSKAPATAGGTRPAPSSGASSPQAAVAVMPPASAAKPSSSAAVGSFGSAVPPGRTSAMVFADFLYPDLV